MKKGNILTLFNADAAMLATIEVLVAANATKYKLVGMVFYIQTPNIVATQTIVAALKKLAVEFLFYYNNISNGSAVLSNPGNPNLAVVKKIML